MKSGDGGPVASVPCAECGSATFFRVGWSSKVSLRKFTIQCTRRRLSHAWSSYAEPGRGDAEGEANAVAAMLAERAKRKGE